MDKYEKNVLVDFLGNNWDLFVAFCEEQEEGLAERFIKSLAANLSKQKAA